MPRRLCLLQGALGLPGSSSSRPHQSPPACAGLGVKHTVNGLKLCSLLSCTLPLPLHLLSSLAGRTSFNKPPWSPAVHNRHQHKRHSCISSSLAYSLRSLRLQQQHYLLAKIYIQKVTCNRSRQMGRTRPSEPRQDSSKKTRCCLLQAHPAAAQPVNCCRRSPANAVTGLPVAALCPWAAQSILLTSSS